MSINVNTVSLIKNKRLSKLMDLYTYYYLCWDGSFMKLTEVTDDLENIDTFESINEVTKLDQELIHKYLETNNFTINKEEPNIILFSTQNDFTEEKDLNNFIKFINFYGFYNVSNMKYKNCSLITAEHSE